MLVRELTKRKILPTLPALAIAYAKEGLQ